MLVARRLLRLVAVLAVLGACSSGGGADAPQPDAQPAVRMHFTRDDSFYAAPFPSDDLRGADGHVSLARLPNPRGIDLVKQSIGLIERDTRGFGTSAAIYFQLTGPLSSTARAALPTLAQSVTDGATVYLVGDDGVKVPVEVAFLDDAGPFGDVNVLALLPLQGTPLRPNAVYSAVITTKVATRAPELAQLLAGTKPDGMSGAAMTTYTGALAALSAHGTKLDEVAGLAVFTTDAPTATLDIVYSDALARPLPKPDAFVSKETFADYCVFQSTIAMPDYQAGTPPFRDPKDGGGFAFDAAGKPLWQRDEKSSLVVTIPRGKVPDAGVPVVVFVRTGGGSDRPLVDRGAHAVAHGDPITPGSGPAHDFAQVGFAGVSVDGPHGGLRNVTGGDEQFLMFNVANAIALRDNVRESAMELALLAHVLETITIDASSCPGVVDGTGAPATAVKFDLAHLALMGHSMGATIAPLTMALESRYRAVILSGAGGSWIENVLYKKEPVEVAPIVELLLGYVNFDRHVTAHDPAVNLFQWATESSDPQVYDRFLLAAPKKGARPQHVLMLQGIVDHYIMPPIANTTSLSMGLDLAGPVLDEKTPEVASLPSLRPLLGFTQRQAIELPVGGNVTTSAGAFTAVVVQHAEDGIEDGHEVVFQTEAPKHQYRCFLASFAKDAPVVVPDGAEEAACP